MCGIAGLATPASRSIDQPKRAGAALRALAHRGPDASGFEQVSSEEIAGVLAAARLRIIDLSPVADQPLSNEDRTVWVVFNGEIYNHVELRRELEADGHRFSSETDTEVLVHLYESHAGRIEGMLSHLRGMFAFAVFDQKRGRLIVARDRLGIKPLYFKRLDGGIAFASEVRALSAIAGESPRVDREALSDYLVWGTVQKPRTILAGGTELAPGSYIDWIGGDVEPRRWWAPEIKPEEWSPEEARELVGAALDDSVRRHLVSDAAVGLFLSGGVDSRMIATHAARWHEKLRTLTVSFPETERDEASAASEIARTVGSEHLEVPVTGANVATHIDRILKGMDQPTSDGVNTWIVSRAAREAGLTVVLSGVGGDELFQGYPTFRLIPRVEIATSLLAPFPLSLRAMLGRSLDTRRPGNTAARVLSAPRGSFGAYRAVRSLFPSIDGRHSVEQSGIGVGADAVMRNEFAYYMSNQLLRDTDQMSMAHSLEARVPLLDDAVIDAALALPAKLRTRATIVGSELASQPKIGFSLPFDRWLRGPLKAFAEEGLLSDDLPFATLVPAERRRRIWETFLESKTHWSRPWAVAVLRSWPGANGFDV